MDGSGNVYVTDAFNYRVKKFDSSGAFLTAWGSQGSGPGQFDVPYGIEVDSTIGAVVSDSNNHRIQRFTTSGTFVSATGSFGAADGQLKYPAGIGAGSGGVYVADSGNDRIQKFKVGGVIQVIKDAVPNDPQDFDFTTGGGLSPASFQLDDDGDPFNALSNSRAIVAATGSGYSVSETVPPGWDLQSATCSDGSPPSNIDVSEGEVVTCTFTNLKHTQIRIVQDTQPDDPQDFDYTAGGGLSPTSFQLDDDGDNSNALSNTQVFDDLAPGSGYSISQTTPGGWSAPEVTCSDGSPASNIDVSPAEVVICTFANVTPTAGRITVVKDAQPNDPQDFDFTAGGGLSPSSFQLDDDGDNSNTLSNQRSFIVAPGSGYSLSESRAQRLVTGLGHVLGRIADLEHRRVGRGVRHLYLHEPQARDPGGGQELAAQEHPGLHLHCGRRPQSLLFPAGRRLRRHAVQHAHVHRRARRRGLLALRDRARRMGAALRDVL